MAERILSEKDQVYTELDRTRLKCGKLKREVNLLRKALSDPELQKMRGERDRYKRALSYIGHAPDAGDDPEHLKFCARLALLGKAWTKDDRTRKRALAANGPDSEQANGVEA